VDGANPGLKRSFLWYRLESSGCKVSVQAIEIGIEIAIAIEIGIGIEIAIGIAIAILAPSFSRETGGLRSIGSVAWGARGPLDGGAIIVSHGMNSCAPADRFRFRRGGTEVPQPSVLYGA
jgi:hypothetical protein